MVRNKVKCRKIISTGIVLTLFTLLIIYINFRNYRDNTSIKKNLKTGSAIITSHATNGKGSSGWFYYEFSYKGILYKESTSDRGIRRTTDVKERFIGSSLIVVFDSLNPDRSRMLIEEKDYKEYNLTMPVDVKWASAYVPERDPTVRILICFLAVFLVLIVKFMRR